MTHGQVLYHPIGAMPGAREDNGALDFWLVKEVEKKPPLVRAIDEHHVLGDALHSGGLRVNLYAYGLV